MLRIYPPIGICSITEAFLCLPPPTVVGEADFDEVVLPGRLGMIGEGAALARKIRQWGQFEEARMRRER